LKTVGTNTNSNERLYKTVSSKCKETETIPMTTCQCMTGPKLVMTRAFLSDLLKFKANYEKDKLVASIIENLTTKKNMYFQQSLIGGAVYFSHKVRFIEEIIKEIEAINVPK
jgi:hypothetical protein